MASLLVEIKRCADQLKAEGQTEMQANVIAKYEANSNKYF